MAKLIVLNPNKTYASEVNAVKAVLRKYPDVDGCRLTYFIQRIHDNRFFPVFIGERAIQAMAHFHFNVVA